jgi:hypothetical protein
VRLQAKSILVLREHAVDEEVADHSVAASIALLVSRGEASPAPVPPAEIKG